MIRAVRHAGEPKMPPSERLSDREIAALGRWVAAGAPDPRTDEIRADTRRSWTSSVSLTND
ncbi:MAG: hypothetical protein CMJ83_15880 [Planctomycetes bacterium]|nr:hypothetical protein [Planctomycetota bacterium]